MHHESKANAGNSSIRSSLVEEQLLMDSLGGEDNDEENGNGI